MAKIWSSVSACRIIDNVCDRNFCQTIHTSSTKMSATTTGKETKDINVAAAMADTVSIIIIKLVSVCASSSHKHHNISLYVSCNSATQKRWLEMSQRPKQYILCSRWRPLHFPTRRLLYWLMQMTAHTQTSSVTINWQVPDSWLEIQHWSDNAAAFQSEWVSE